MEFDKSKVYTALNADELKVGSKVMVSNNINDLMYLVNNISEGLTLRDIKDKCNQNRFEIINEHKEISCWNLAYLISEPEEKKLKWTDLKIGDIIKHPESSISHMVIAIDSRTDNHKHIRLWDAWLDDEVLKQFDKVEK